MRLNTMKNICLIGLNSSTPEGSKVCSLISSYKPQDSRGVQQLYKNRNIEK
jgi:hypothetical protein